MGIGFLSLQGESTNLSNQLDAMQLNLSFSSLFPGPFPTAEQQFWVMNIYKIDGTHVTIFGQHIIAQFVMHFVMEQWNRQQAPLTRPLQWVSQKEVDMYLQSVPLHISTLQDKDAPRRRSIVGFASGEDVPGGACLHCR